MTPREFFDNFGKLAEAPNGVQKLRELILQLAVRGKLVPQDSSDEPASKLLERIRAEKAQLVKERRIRNADPLPPATPHEVPYELPQGWEWASFGTIAQHNSGKTLDKGRNTGVPRSYITTSNLYWGRFDLNNVREMLIRDDELEKCTARKNDLLICEGGEAGRAAVWESDTDVCFQNHVHRARFYCDINPYYIFRFFEKLNATGEIGEYRKGVGISNMSSKALSSIALPLPPLAEQHRIVAKVNQLMALCDELEAQQQKSRQKLIRLNNAALDRLTSASGADDFAAAWPLVRDSFDLLYSDPGVIAKLRQSILQLAVQGKLVPQDPADEPAAKLLERIRTEKARLGTERKVRKGNPLPPVAAEEMPYELPQGWEWGRLGDLREVVEYGTSQKAHDMPRGVPILRMNNIVGGKVVLVNLKYVESSIDELPKLYLKENDLLFNRTNSYELVGKTGIFRGASNKYTFASYLIRIRILQLVNPYYVNIVMNSPFYRVTQIEPEITQQCGQANFNGTKLVNSLIPIPPLAEQERIVAKVERLQTLCERIETQLIKVADKAQKLTKAAVQGVLAC